MKKIASFTVNHDTLTEGIYVSRIDGDVTTYDLRTRVPNSGDYMDNLAMHSVEHMLATFLRNGKIADKIIYFGPMGCQTGFYLLVRDADNAETLTALISALEATLSADEMFGQSRIECGKQSPSFPLLVALAEELHVDMAELVSERDSRRF